MVKENNSLLVKPTLGLLGATMNAMALIAPGAFLWIMYQLQAAATAPRRAGVANGIWASIVVTLIVTLLTVFSHLQSAKMEAASPRLLTLRSRPFLIKKVINKIYSMGGGQ